MPCWFISSVISFSLMLQSFFQVSKQPSRLPQSPSQLPPKSSLYPLLSSQLPLRPSQLPLRPSQLTLRPSRLHLIHDPPCSLQFKALPAPIKALLAHSDPKPS